MKVTIECSEGEIHKVQNEMKSASTASQDIKFNNLGEDGLQVTFDQEFDGGETATEDVFSGIAKYVWSKLGRFVPIYCQTIDKDSPLWADDEDPSFIEYACSAFFDFTEIRYENLTGRKAAPSGH
jgi:hypothetical protein